MGIAFQRTATPILDQPEVGRDAAVGRTTAAAGGPAPADRAPATPTPRLACDWLLVWYDRHRVFYLSLLVLFYVAGFNGSWRPEPDSALYLSIGRNLADGAGYTYNGLPHALAYPGMPYLHAVIFKLTGLHTEWPALLVVFAMGLAALGLLYRLFWLHTDRATAVFLTCMVGMTYTVYRYAFELRNEVPFLLGVLGFLVGWEAWVQARQSHPRRAVQWYDTLLMIAGLALAVVMRPHMWVLLAASIGALTLVALRSTRWWLAVAAIAAIVCTVGLLVMLDPRWGGHPGGTYEGGLALSAAGLLNWEGLQLVGTRTYDLLNRSMAEAAFGHELGPVLTIVGGTALAACGVLLVRRRRLWGLFVIGTFVMMVFTPTREPTTMPRYLMPVLPLLAVAWWAAMVRVNRAMPNRWGNIAFALMLAVWVAPNFLRICKTIAEQRYPPLDRSYGLYQSLREFASDIERQVPEDTPVLAHRRLARVLAYWSDRCVSADYEMSAAWVPQYVVWPGDADVHRRLEKQHLQVGDVVARVRDPLDPEADWTLRRVVPAP